MKNFKEMLATNGSAAQETLADAMVEWWMAQDHEDALRQINANPGEDLAGITNSVLFGLTSLAKSLNISVESLVSEEQLSIFSTLTAMDVVLALNAIHIQWMADNFTARRWAEKYFKGQLFQYRKTAKLPWSEVLKDDLFIREYYGKYASFESEDLEKAFEEYSTKYAEDNDLPKIAEKARTFAHDIIYWIVKYRDKLNPEKKANEIAKINEFLSKHQDGTEIMEIMIKVVCE